MVVDRIDRAIARGAGPGGARVLTHRGVRSVAQGRLGPSSRTIGAGRRAYARSPCARASPPPLWRNPAFVRVWSAATISIFGSLITRHRTAPRRDHRARRGRARGRDPARAVELGAALVFGLVAGAWVDRLRRRPVLIWADLGRMVLLGSVPVAFVAGVADASAQLVVVTGLAVDPDDVLRRRRHRLPAHDRRARRSWSMPTGRSRRAARRPSSWPSGSAASSSSC